MRSIKMKFFSVILITAIISNVVPVQTIAASHLKFASKKAMSRNERNIKETTKQLNEIKNDQKKYRETEKKLKNQIQDISKQVEEIDNNLKNLKQQCQKQQQEIDFYNEKISKNEEILQRYKNEINKLNSSLDKTKYSTLGSVKNSYCEYKGGGLLQRVLSSENMSELVKTAEYLRRQSDYDKKIIDDFTTQINGVNKLKEEEENIQKNNRNFKKIADEKMKSIRKSETEINSAIEIKRKNLSMLDRSMQSIKSKTKDLEKTQQMLEKAKKNFQETDDSLNELIDSRKSLYINKDNSNEHKTLDDKHKRSKSAPPGARNGKFLFPLPSGRISSGYGRRGRGFHHGMDICAPKGTKIYASADGVATHVGQTPYGGGYGGYGLCVHLSHENGFSTLYGHMNKVYVTTGQRVTKGQIIGEVGRTGDAGVNHLHWEVRKNNTKLNPANYY